MRGQFRSGLSLYCRFSSGHINDLAGRVGVMEPSDSDSTDDRVEITIPRWVFNRIVVLLVAANGGQSVSNARLEEYVSAVLEGHARKLNL